MKTSSFSSSPHRSPGLDLLRAFAVIWVLLFHYSIRSPHAPLRAVGEFGWMGVDLFFVLSGYLIGHQLFKNFAAGRSIDFKSFYLRRFLRTLPLYFAVLAVYLAFPSWRESPHLAPTWKYLTFTLNLALDRRQTGAFTHAWSLCVEEQFYLVLPLIVVWLGRYGNPKRVFTALLGIFALGILVRSLVWLLVIEPALSGFGESAGSFYHQYLYYPTYARLDGLLVGVGLALTRNFQPDHWQTLIRRRKLVFALSTVCLGSGIFLSDTQFTLAHSAFAYPLIAVGFGGWLICCVNPQAWPARFKVPGAQFIATLSYALYLVQKLVFHGVEHYLPTMGLDPYSYGGFVVTFFSCITLSLLAHTLIERPFLKLRDSLLALRGQSARVNVINFSEKNA